MAAEPCAACHPQETAAFKRSPMGRSIGEPSTQPDGRVSDTRADTVASAIHRSGPLYIRLQRSNLEAVYAASYAVGAGQVGYTDLIAVGRRLYQSPISYYAQAGRWDLTPGYETEDVLDLDKPVVGGCLFCHAGSVEAVPGTSDEFVAGSLRAISCERCHGPAAEHLARPVAGSIVNPAKLPRAARDSVCEQCHLEGAARILAAGKDWWNFRAGSKLEDVFVTYVETGAPAGRIKAVSQSEQLAASRCVIASEGKLWCGSCHNPHAASTDRKGDIRRVCLSCHQSLFDSASHRPADDCIACHMPRLKAGNVPHTAITDHSIPRMPAAKPTAAERGAGALRAWRNPDSREVERAGGLAEFELGTARKDAAAIERAYRLLGSYVRTAPTDARVIAALGAILLDAGERERGVRFLTHASVLDPKNPAIAYSLAIALDRTGDRGGAVREFRRTIALDPAFTSAYTRLADLYEREGREPLRRATIDEYLRLLPQSIVFRLLGEAP